MGRYKLTGVVVRDLDEIKIVFYTNQSVYVFPKRGYSTSICFNRWFESGTYKDWKNFRDRLMRNKKLTLLDCYHLASVWGVKASSSVGEIDLKGKKVIYRK